MKKLIFYITFIALMLSTYSSYACDVCKKNQPKGLEDITHGAGPEGNIDYIITWSATAIVLLTLYLSVKYLIAPKELNENHIKTYILNEGKFD